MEGSWRGAKHRLGRAASDTAGGAEFACMRVAWEAEGPDHREKKRSPDPAEVSHPSLHALSPGMRRRKAHVVPGSPELGMTAGYYTFVRVAAAGASRVSTPATLLLARVVLSAQSTPWFA